MAGFPSGFGTECWGDAKRWPVECPCGNKFRKDEGFGGGRYCSLKCWEDLGVSQTWFCMECGLKQHSIRPKPCEKCGHTIMAAV